MEIKDCRKQRFDNGCYNGVQAQISKINLWATFFPCVTYSLNLIVLHAAETSALVVTFFGIVHRRFTYFSGSTGRWDKLNAVLKITLKSHCETRWSSMKRTITALYTQINDIYILLQNISNDSSNNIETISGIYVLNDIFLNINQVNCSLQSKNISIDCANTMLKELLRIMQKMRESGIKNYVKISTTLAVKLGIEPHFSKKR